MRHTRPLTLLLALAALTLLCPAAFPTGALAQGVTGAEVHFWPPLADDRDQRRLEEIVVDRIGRASSTLLIQAYLFTNANVADAVLRASDRGVLVRIVVDLDEETDIDTQAHFLQRQGIEVRSDHKFGCCGVRRRPTILPM